MQALVNKYIHFDGHTSSGPDENFGSVASGASDDWFYATLGAAGVTFELGNAFRQDCNYFENSILSGNLKALTYAAKVSSKPYSLPKGPDIVSMIVNQQQVVNLPGAFVTVALDVSDTIFAASQELDSTQQTVDVVRVYVDVHPYDDGGNTGPLFTLTGSQLQAGVSSEGSPTTLGVATIVLDQLIDPRPGRHAIYVDAIDSDGIVGPVMAAWFEILSPPSPTQAPEVTEFPTETPTTYPATKPTIVSTISTSAPSKSSISLPTLSPTLQPSSAPKLDPTASPSLLAIDLPSNVPSLSSSNLPTPEDPLDLDSPTSPGVSFTKAGRRIPLMLLSAAALCMVLF